jgi:hypothetical protein
LPVFIAVISDLETAPCAVVNVNCLDDRAHFTAPASMHEFQLSGSQARHVDRVARPAAQFPDLRRPLERGGRGADRFQTERAGEDKRSQIVS